jgi:cell division protein FtsX
MLDNLLTAALGILVTLMGFGKIPVSKNTEKNREYLDKYGAILRIGGIMLIVIGLLLAISTFFRR